MPHLHIVYTSESFTLSYQNEIITVNLPIQNQCDLYRTSKSNGCNQSTGDYICRISMDIKPGCDKQSLDG